MASTIVVIIKIMPSSTSSNLHEIEDHVRKKMESHGGRSVTFEQKEVAFGLKSITLKMAFPEEKGTDLIESLILEVPEVSSVTIEDYRRAFG